MALGLGAALDVADDSVGLGIAALGGEPAGAFLHEEAQGDQDRGRHRADDDHGLPAIDRNEGAGDNDIPIVSRLPAPLTSVRVPFDRIAAAALERLVAEPSLPRDRIQFATPTLIPRKSTAAPQRR